MRKRYFPLALLAASLLPLSLIAQTPSLDLQVDHPTAQVSPTLYGLMTEEINFSYDGGIYAEMVRNRMMTDDWSGVHNWYLVELGNAECKMSIDHSGGPSKELTRGLKIEVANADARNQAGVLNEGWWGMALRPSTTYKGSFWAKADSSAMGPLTVALVSNSTGMAVASTTVSGLTAEWKQFSYALTTGAIEPSAANHLEITVGHVGTLWLELVSLFPPTYHDRHNGNRVDLMEKLAAMHPKFLRFPGGNYLEGNHIAERFNWKQTVGPMVNRPTHIGPWGYHSSDGMGLQEFLNWCEDLKMEPVLAVYAGYSLSQEHVNPGPDLEPYVQDALDEIEYVTGGLDTKWGKVRAENGHPVPFKLTYVEIGNEDNFDNSKSYEGRYEQFYKAIKAKYPALQLIATMPIKNMRPDVVDDHYYVRRQEFFADQTHYDKTDRTGPKIFVGEWATREGAPTPNFGSALGDAAWMTGLERNSDIVVMAAYAPLLVNVNPGGMQWETDLIGYDALSSYGSPSYWAQVLFGKYLGTEVVPATLSNAGPRLFASATRDEKRRKLFVKVVNATSNEAPLSIALEGIGQVKRDALLITLSGKTPNATNSITHSDAVVPVEHRIQVAGPKFEEKFAPYSINVLELSY
jgi:alpha-N-arabinofuranosidase